MAKISEIIRWLWAIKERIVLAVVLACLGYRIYIIIYPGDIIDKPPIDKPSDRLEGIDVPPLPERPKEQESVSWNSIHYNSPFWYRAPGTTNTNVKDGGDSEAQIKLLQILDTPTGSTVQLSAGASRTWCREGSQFQKYEVVSIDLASGTCEVRSERLGKVITLRKNE